jgi:hypothetical protein
MWCSGSCRLDPINLSTSNERAQARPFPKPLVEEWGLAFTQNNHDDLFVRISTVRDSLLLVFRKNRQLFLELLASIGINDIIVPQKMGVGVGWGGVGGGMVVKEEMVVVAKEK